MASSQTIKTRETPEAGAAIQPIEASGDFGRQRVTPPKAQSTPALARPGLLHHRVREIVWHTPWYGFKTQARLARDAQVAPSTISRLLRGKELPSLVVALRLTSALSRRSSRALDIREVFSLDGTYPTNSVCALMGCRKCVPPLAFDQDDNLRSDFQGMDAGQWSLPPRVKGNR